MDKLKSDPTLKYFQEVMEKTDNNSWEELKSTITQNADKILGKHIQETKKSWMTAEILELIKKKIFGEIKTTRITKESRILLQQNVRKPKKNGWMKTVWKLNK